MHVVAHRAFILPLILCGALLGCTSSARSPRASAAPPPAPEPVRVVADAKEAATEHFYRGKALALAGDGDCARLEFTDALEGFREKARPGDAEDLEFAGQLFESIKLYRGTTDGQVASKDRPPVEESRDSLIAPAPAPKPEEVEAAKREVAQSRPETLFDIPIVVNERVLRAVAFYQFRTPQHFAAALQRSGRYLPMMRAVLKSQGLPADLVYVAMIESAFKSGAHSRKAAHGFWQFIEDTGRRYGLRRSRSFDERSDPLKSTMAAAAYFKDLYEMFGDWHLAMAGYDTGEGRILRGLQRTGARDYWELSATNALMQETKDYVPYVLAAALIAKNPARYGFDVVTDPPMEFDVVSIRKPLDLASVAQTVGTTLEEMHLLNGELKTRSTPHGVSEYNLRVPAGTAGLLTAAFSKLPAAPEMQERQISVRKGDTVARVAARQRVSIAELCDWNDLTPSSRLKRGMVLVIADRRGTPMRHGRPSAASDASDSTIAGGQPRTDSVETRTGSSSASNRPRGSIRALPTPGSAITVADLAPLATSASPASSVASLSSTSTPATAVSRPAPAQVDIPEEGFEPEPARRSVQNASVRRSEKKSHQKVTYTVRRGDTLFRIAQQYGLTVDAIRRLNGIRRREAIAAGRRLTLVLASTR
ncbi:MAG: LysM peptidoglycan-binding domain-containing protein [Thermoanaerobaculia bacterium]